MDYNEKYGFTKDEWETCLRVLDRLKDDPLNNPDNLRLKTLILAIKKRSKKALRKISYTTKRSEDLMAQKETVMVSNAVAGISTYGTLNASISEKSRFSQLNIPKNCYCCNKSYTLMHFHYNRLCPGCATLNYEKRFQQEDLTGYHAIVTGCRVKIGYATTLKLLRSGASVIGTSRFPALALEQFQQEEDFEEWKEKLELYGLDLRNLKQLDDFILFVKQTYGSLEILINNAAQTIRYPADYYTPLIAKEQQLLETVIQKKLVANTTPLGETTELSGLIDINNTTLPEINRFGQPVDERQKTSWNSTLEEIDLTELLEVNLINQISPYQLIKQLKPLMEKENCSQRHIINVTSSEGMFSYVNKTIFHPHTNMTKASLNMLTRTSAPEFEKQGILMNSVDVGWVSTGANETLRKKQFEKAYIPPLDSVDGASRILDPIHEAMQGRGISGKLLKDYQVHDW